MADPKFEYEDDLNLALANILLILLCVQQSRSP